jgi:hypothetical protein
VNALTQRMCAWCGPVCAVLWLFGFWVFAGFVPPPSPNSSAEEIARMFQHDTNSIRFGLLLLMFAGALYGPWTAVIAVQMKRIEGRYSPMAYTQLALGAVFVLVFILPVMIWQSAAYRPFGSPELIQRMNDTAWFMFLGPVSTILVQGLAIGIAFLSDRRTPPVLPRWLGFFSIWAVILFLPGALIVFFKDGPFAWNGLFAWWIPLPVFTVWMILLSVMLLKAITQQEQQSTVVSEHDPLEIQTSS